MILPDVNVLVYAFHRDSPGHPTYAAWLGEVVGGAVDLALVDVVLTGFVRVVTSRRIFSDAASTGDALAFVDALRAAPRGRPLPPSEATWDRLRTVADTDAQVRGNLVPDAWLAALALTHGCQVATADRGFARFEGLEWFDPGSA